MEPNANEDIGTVLLEIDGNLLPPPQSLNEQADFNIDKALIADVGSSVDDEITDILHKLGKQSDELTTDLFEPFVPSFLKDSEGGSNITPAKRSLSESSLQSREDAKKARWIQSESQTIDYMAPHLNEDKDSKQKENEQDECTKNTKPKHVCKECRKVFKRAHNLKIHGRLHSGAKPYSCPFAKCEKEFRWKSSIVSHMNWHRTKKGDTLPGEPEDRSVQAAALRQGTTRKANGERRSKLKDKRTIGREETAGAESEYVEPSSVWDENYGIADTRSQAEDVVNKAGVGETDEEEQAESDEKDWIEEGCGYEATVDVNDFMVEMTQLTKVYAESGATKAEVEGEGGKGGANSKGMDAGVFTPSTTADSFEHSAGATMELDDLVAIPISGMKRDEVGGDEGEGEMLGDIGDCSAGESAYPFVGLLEE